MKTRFLVSADTLFDSRLTPGERIVLAWLERETRGARWRHVCPTDCGLGCGLSERTAYRALTTLVRMSLVAKKRRRGKTFYSTRKGRGSCR